MLSKNFISLTNRLCLGIGYVVDIWNEVKAQWGIKIK